jgi:hypothetical protein
MDYDYSKVSSLDAGEFQRLRAGIDFTKFTKTDESDLRMIESLLDLSEGSLPRDGYYLETTVCGCGRNMTFYDFVFTSLIDAGHPKSFTVHTLLGNKYIRNKPRQIRCSGCLAKTSGYRAYITPRYDCCGDPPSGANT